MFLCNESSSTSITVELRNWWWILNSSQSFSPSTPLRTSRQGQFIADGAVLLLLIFLHSKNSSHSSIHRCSTHQKSLALMGREAEIRAQGPATAGLALRSTGTFCNLIKLSIFVNPLPPDVLLKYESMFSRNRRASEGDNWTEVGGGARASKRGSR